MIQVYMLLYYSPGSVLATFSADFDVTMMDPMIATNITLLVEYIRMEVASAFVNYCKINNYDFMNATYSCSGINMFYIIGGKHLIFHASSSKTLN